MAVDRRRWLGRAEKLFAVIGALVTALAAVVGLLFGLNPGLRPCLGTTRARIRATVFPGETYAQYLREQGYPQQVTRETGPVVSWTVETDGYRGQELQVKYTVFHVRRDGSLGSVVSQKLDRFATRTVAPSTCSDQGGYDDFIHLRHASRRRRYRILLEVFSPSGGRIDFTETPIFSE
jgi:hypothetical protein